MSVNEQPNRIREWRERRGLSQQALGRKLGVGNQQISKLETGALRLSTLWMDQLAVALDCEPWELMRSPQTTRADAERQALDHFRALDEEGRERVLQLLLWLRGKSS